jgi:hypothetical protein
MAEVRYSARLVDPGYAIERGRNNTITCPVYAGATLTAPASGTCTIRTENGSISSGAISVASSIAEYTITSAQMAGLDFSDDVSVEWALTMPDGVVHTFRSEGAICRVSGQQRIVPEDLYRLEPYLNPSSGGAVWSQTGADQCIEAHLEVETELWLAGRRPYLVVSQSALRRVELMTALRMCCEALATTGRQTFVDKAERYTSLLERTKQQATLQYDVDGDGRIDDSSHRSSMRRGSYRLGSVRPSSVVYPWR